MTETIRLHPLPTDAATMIECATHGSVLITVSMEHGPELCRAYPTANAQIRRCPICVCIGLEAIVADLMVLEREIEELMR